MTDYILMKTNATEVKQSIAVGRDENDTVACEHYFVLLCK
jgi:hypothetical protein